MKKLLSIAVLIFAVSIASAQSEGHFYRYGKSVSKFAQYNPDATRTILARQFDVYGYQVDMLLKNLNGDWGGVADALAIGAYTNNFPEDVWKAVQQHGTKGWGAVAKSLGVKKGSVQYHYLKRFMDRNQGYWNELSRDVNPMIVEVVKVKFEKK